MSDAAASSQSGEKPNAAIELSSTTLPAVFRLSSSPASGSPARPSPLDVPDELDRDPQQVLRRRLVEPRAAREPRQHDFGGLVHCAAERGGERPDARSGSDRRKDPRAPRLR